MPHIRPPAPRAHIDANGDLFVSVPWSIARRALVALRTACPDLEVSAESNPYFGMTLDAVVAILVAERHLRQPMEAVR